MMNNTAMIQKRIWLLRASIVVSVMIAPSPEMAARRALLALSGSHNLWAAAWPVQAKGSSDLCGIWIARHGRIRKRFENLQGLRPQQVEKRPQRGIVIVAAPGGEQFHRRHRIGFHRA